MELNITESDLKELSGPNEQVARVAFDRLFKNSSGFVHWYLDNRFGKGRDDIHDDIVQETFVRLWLVRQKFEIRGTFAYLGFMKKVAYNLYIDWSRSNFPSVTIEEIMKEIPDEKSSLFEQDCQELLKEITGLFSLADHLLLGLEPTLSPTGRARLVVAAQLYYLDGESAEEIVHMLPRLKEEIPNFSAATLEKALHSPDIVRLLTFETLYHSNIDMAGALLGMPKGTLSPEKMKTMLCEATEVGSTMMIAGLLPYEVAFALWHYGYGEKDAWINENKYFALSEIELETLRVKFEARFPFLEQMNALIWGVQSRWGEEGLKTLRKPGTWKRLLFEYRVKDELEYLDIWKRIGVAASAVQYTINPDTLGVWMQRTRESLFVHHLRRAEDGNE